MIVAKRIVCSGLLKAEQLPALFCREGIAWQRLDCAPWAEAYPYRPDVSFAIAHNGTQVLLCWRVAEDAVRAMAPADGGRVWEDSCCEAFIQLPGQPHYYNLECNCAGQLLLACGPDRHNRLAAPAATMASISRTTSLGRQPFDLRQGPCLWHMELAVPATVFFADHVECLSGIMARANFYKCGDLLPRPHFLSHYPIPLPHPDFHCPQHFGDLLFE